MEQTVSVDDLAHALWQMFAYGNDAKAWDDRAKANWLPKAIRTMQLARKTREARLEAQAN